MRSSADRAYGSAGSMVGKERVAQRIGLAVDLDRTLVPIDAVQQAAVLEVHLGVAPDGLALELELHDRRCLLHPRHRPHLAQAVAARHEALCRVVGIDAAHQVLEGLHGDAVAFLELRQAAVAHRDAQDVGDERLLAEGGADPGGIVVAPGEGHVGLALQVADHPVRPGPAVEAIAGDDQLVDGEIAQDVDGEPNRLGDAVVPHQGVDDRVGVLALAIGRRLAEHLLEEGRVLGGEDPLHAPVRAAARQGAHDLEQIAHRASGPGPHRLAPTQLRKHAVEHLARIEDERQQILQLGRGETLGEHSLDQRAQRTRGVVDDVAQLGVLAVHVADHVNRSPRQGQLGRQPCDLGDGRARCRETDGQAAGAPPA